MLTTKEQIMINAKIIFVLTLPPILVASCIIGLLYFLLCHNAKSNCEFMAKYYGVETSVDGIDCMVKGTGDLHWYSDEHYRITHE